MTEILRKKSPRAPAIALPDAIERVMKIYERERLHPAPSNIVAQHMGYKDANNGRSLTALASLRYFGLLERPKEGLLAVSKDIEAYKFAPDEKLKHSLLLSFLKRPALYNELLEKYNSGLPSDANLKYELIQRGFVPQGADAALSVFKKSVQFADYYNGSNELNESSELDEGILYEDAENDIQNVSDKPILQKSIFASQSSVLKDEDYAGLDRIPVRLTGARRAWIIVPTPFFNADKDRLKAQIDLLLTDEDEQSSN